VSVEETIAPNVYKRALVDHIVGSLSKLLTIMLHKIKAEDIKQVAALKAAIFRQED